MKRPTRRLASGAGMLIAVLLGGSACRAPREPAGLVAEADRLRSRFERDASRQAVALYREAAAELKRRGDDRGVARAALGAGAASDQLGEPRPALVHYLEAVDLARSAGDPLLESGARSEAGIAQARLTDLRAAASQCQMALDLSRASNGPREEARAQICLGEVDYNQFRDHRGALVHYQAAESLARRAGDQRGEAEACLYQGWVHSDLRELDQAESCYARARARWVPRDDRRGGAMIALAEARLAQRRGRYQDALTGYREVLARLEPSGDDFWLASTLTGVADVYLVMGNAAGSLPYWERAYQVFEQAGLSNHGTEVLMTIGATYLALGDDQSALPYLQKADDRTARLGSDRWRGKTLRNLAVVDLIRRRPEQARTRLEQSLAIQRSLGDAREPGLAARTSADMGDVYLMLQDSRAAARWFGEALATSRAAVNRVEEARALFGLGRAAAALGDLDAARANLQSSVQVVESLRTAVENRELRSSFFASVYAYHEAYLDVLLKLDRQRPGRGIATIAFEANERARARSLLESLADAGVDFREGVDAALLARETEVRVALDTWAERQRRLAAGPMSDADVRDLRRDHLELEDRYEQVQADLRRASPQYAALSQPQPLSLRQAQRLLLDPDTVLLEYALGAERSYLWVVSSRDTTAYVLPPREEIETAATRLYAVLADRGLATGDAAREAATALSGMVLGPAAAKIVGKRLLVVADGALHAVPFAALPVPGRSGDPVPMVAEHEIVNVPSASVLAALRQDLGRRDLPPGSVAVLADPVFEADDPRLRAALRNAPSASLTHPPAGDSSGGPAGAVADSARSGGSGRTAIPARLPATKQEADIVVAMAPAATSLKLTGFAASRDAARDPGLGRYRIVHFATHGVFDNDSPGQSGIYLSLFDQQGGARVGLLSLQDIYGLRMPVDLVVLSACNTALGRPVRGEGIVGITRGFMYAGARRVVSSLWKVDDDATAELMRRFYAEMFQRGLPPAAALRQVQLGMWREDRWRAPFYWAAFVLQGEWR